MKKDPHNYWADVGGGMIICCKCGRTEKRERVKRFCPDCGSHNRCADRK